MIKRFRTDGEKSHLLAALTIIKRRLEALPISHAGVAESYINAAELYLQLQLPDETLKCLHAAIIPATAFNSGFRLALEPDDSLSEEDASVDSSSAPSELPEYLSPVIGEADDPEDLDAKQVLRLLDESEKFELTDEEICQVTRLSVGAYTMKRDFAKVAEHAKLLQTREVASDVYLGIYAEANALKEQGSLLADSRYKEAIRFFRNAMIRNPGDILALTTRIQCCIDILDFAQAEELCTLMSKDARELLLSQISKAKATSQA